MKKILFSTVLLSVVLFSCKKDDDTCDLNQSSIVGTYKITSVKYKASTSAPEIDDYATWDACEKDDRVVFNANGMLTFQDTGVQCSPTGDDTGTWTLTGSTLSVDGNLGTVVAFDCNGMVLAVTGANAGELTTVGFTRQ